jgi:DNA-binding NarL/FixJ family response regulator
MTSPAKPSARILVVEDEPQMLRNLLTILRAEGFHALGAPGGEEGVSLARSERPDLVLCDLMMPGMDGFGVLGQLRADAATASIPFVFLTARGERDEVRAGMNSGADDYLTKPVKVDDLLLAIRVRLERHSQATSRRPSEPAELRRLGVTGREAEVLFWLVEGKSNADIASILGMAPATVKKHLEHVFEKLGVENRVAATMTVLERLAAPDRT